jgi:hypothetical protein
MEAMRASLGKAIRIWAELTWKTIGLFVLVVGGFALAVLFIGGML